MSPRTACLVALTAATSFGAPALPPELPVPRGTAANVPTLSLRTYDEVEVLQGRAHVKKAGQRLSGYLSFVPEGAQQPAEAAWKAWLPLLTAKGWTLAGEDGAFHSLKRGAAGQEQFLSISLGDYQDPHFEAVLAASTPTKLRLPPPAATATATADSADFPFLPRFPGSTFSGTGADDSPFLVTRPAETQAQVVASGSVVKSYTPPASLSKLETALSYTEALKSAGWEVLVSDPPEGRVVAHFSKGGRNVWLAVGRSADDSDSGLRFWVADVGAADWGRQLDAECRLTLVGVTFDFDKATLRPDSTVVLEKAAALLKTRPALALEVQGHTDTVGDETYNQKLSAQRAETVRAWLVAHGAVGATLTAKGYGKNHPVADNDTDAGRARNRRVDLSCLTAPKR